jgi:hypothetical protein
VDDLETLEIRTYISEPDRGPQSWINQEDERESVYANRPCAHLYETDALRRAHVRGHGNLLEV